MKLTMKHLLLSLGTVGAVAAPVAAVVACGNKDDNSTPTTGTTATQIATVKTAIATAQTAGIKAINTATDVAGVDSALAAAKAAVTVAISSPVVASDVTIEVAAANSALESAAADKKVDLARPGGKTFHLDVNIAAWHALFHVGGTHAFIGKENDILEIWLPSGDMSHKLSATDVSTITTAFGTTAGAGQNEAVNAIVAMFVAQDSSKEAEIKASFRAIAAFASLQQHSITIA